MHLFSHVTKNLAEIFSGKNLGWFVGAILLSIASVYSGFDWFWYVAAQGSAFYKTVWPAVMIGSFIPVFGVLMYLILGALFRSASHIRNAWALGQAALLGYVISSVLKAFTGRIPPPHEFVQGMEDMSHGFQFGFLKGGVFWGWPSSHTTVAFAMAAALIALYPKNRIVRVLACIYALYIGIGISVSIHWFSEFIAGALIGWVIGKAVGRSFGNKPIEPLK